MTSPSGFVDFNQYLGANQDEETRLLKQALERAQQADAGSASAIRRSARDATAQGKTDATATLSGVSSYSDYLKAKQEAENSWADVTGPTGNPFADAVRGVIRSRKGADAMAAGAQQQRDELEARKASEVDRDVTSLAKSRGQDEARTASQRAAQDERARSDANMKKDFYESTYQRGDEYSPFTPFGPGSVGQSDQQRWAQMLTGAKGRGDWGQELDKNQTENLARQGYGQYGQLWDQWGADGRPKGG